MSKKSSKRRPAAGPDGGASEEGGYAPDKPIYVVNAFATGVHAGNPAAVCVLKRPAEPEWMQRVAREMNLSETAFLWREGRDFSLRWFTPTVEVDLCGHATLASAHILWETGELRPDEVASFRTKSGTLKARHIGGVVEMDFPAVPSETVKRAPRALMNALGAKAARVSRTKDDYLVELESERAVVNLKPDIAALKKLGLRGVIVTARSKKFSFVSRFFAPGAGIDEDPVTGSAHCALGPYWQDKIETPSFIGYQASARGGLVYVSVRGDRVRLAGKGVTMLRGELLY